MERVLPFCALRYNDNLKDKIDELVAPPYDIVTQKERDYLVSRNEFNIFSIELPTPYNNLTPFENAGRLFRLWLEKKILVCDESPSIYPYYIDYLINGERLTRKGFISLIRLEDWDTKIVKPHERTFNKVTTDRLNLLKNVRANLSPIFMLYKSKENISQIIDNALNSPIYTVKDNANNIHSIYKISDSKVIKLIQKSLLEATFYIADGHHRYTTSLEFSKLTNDSKAKYIMTYLVDHNDNGLKILPTHRIIKLDNYHITIPNELENLIYLEKFKIEGKLDRSNVNDIIREIKDKHKRFILLIDLRQNVILIFHIKSECLVDISNDNEKTLLSLDVYILEEIILKRLLNLSIETLKEEGRIRYISGYEIDFSSLDDNEVIFYLNPTTVEDVINISDKNLIMPQKSTYFYPKILTGFVINSFDYSLNVT